MEVKRKCLGGGKGDEIDCRGCGRYSGGMPRTARASVGGIIYHALNRGHRRETVFHKPADFDGRVAGVRVPWVPASEPVRSEAPARVEDHPWHPPSQAGRLTSAAADPAR